MRVLLVGLDAACLPVLEPLFEDGVTPTIERLYRKGASGMLESQIPPWTASAWPSLYTGMNPGKHGVFDFLAFDGYDWDIVNATHVRERTLWDYLDHHGLTSVVVNAPVAHPPRPIDGAVVPGYLAPEDPPGHPRGIVDEVREAIGEYRVYAHRETDERAADEAKYEEYLELTRIRGEAFRYLVDRFDPTFGFLQFQKTDAVFHDFPGDDEKVRGVYRAVDKQVATTLEACDPECVIVASDHGIGPYGGLEFRVNERLRREGLIKTSRGEGVPSWFQIKDERLTGSDGADSPSARGGFERVARLAAKAGLTYQRGKALLDRLGLAEVVGRHVPVSAVFAASEGVDYAASTAYLRSPSELGVRLNVAGRDPAGVVPREEYEATRERVMEQLRAVETPDCERVFERVLPREAVFEGSEADRAVDIVTVPADFDHGLSALVGEEFTEPEPYNHKQMGLVSVTGEGVDGAALTDAHLFDVAPTVLGTLGLPVAERMDGAALVGAPERERYPTFEGDAPAATDDSVVQERLADLGYLE